MTDHRKLVRHYHEPGDLHELTFSCFRRWPLLEDERWKRWLCESIDHACQRYAFRLVAFVLMPEHVHLLVDPTVIPVAIDRLLFAIKRPPSIRIKYELTKANSPLLSELTVQERPGKMAFRLWQEGPGYDRNLSGEAAAMTVIDYFHLNPVRRGLVDKARDWKWSSARWYESEGKLIDPDLPTIHGLHWSFFS